MFIVGPATLVVLALVATVVVVGLGGFIWSRQRGHAQPPVVVTGSSAAREGAEEDAGEADRSATGLPAGGHDESAG